MMGTLDIIQDIDSNSNKNSKLKPHQKKDSSTGGSSADGNTPLNQNERPNSKIMVQQPQQGWEAEVNPGKQLTGWRAISEWQKNPAALSQERRVYLATLYGSQILPRVYLGSRLAALDEKWLKERNITHILTIAGGIKPAFPKSYKYKVIEIRDHQNQNILEHFDSTHRFIEKALASRAGNVLVHCQAGISRSASVMIAYLMKSQNLDFDEAFSFLASKRSIICPNLGFRYQLQLYELMGCHRPKKQMQYWLFALQLWGKTVSEPFRSYGF